ncbi:MAG: hypothetical protein AAF696_32845 [Bacteroidota bacterium]
MKTEKYESYQIEIAHEDIHLHYLWKRQDFVYARSLALICLTFLGLFIYGISEGAWGIEDSYWSYILRSISFSLFLAFLRLAFGKIFEPRKNILHWDKTEEALKIKSHKGTYILPDKELMNIEYESIQKAWHKSPSFRPEFEIEVYIRTKDAKKSKLFRIQESALLQDDDILRKRKMEKLAQELTNRLADLLGISSKQIKGQVA